MTTVNTVEDIIEVLDADPLLRDALRARLLTRDLIELPHVVAELAASQLRLEATLHQFMATTDERLKGLEAGQQALMESQRTLEANQRELAANQQTMAADQRELAANQQIANSRLDRLEITVNDMRLDVDSMKGDHMEMRLQGKAQSLLAERMSLRRVQIVRALYPAGSLQSFIDAVHDAEEIGLITERHYMRIIATDLIVSARRRGGGENVYVALEVSNKLDRGDVDRAKLTAEALALTFPQTEILTAVYGREISDADRAYAESEGVEAILDDSRR